MWVWDLDALKVRLTLKRVPKEGDAFESGGFIESMAFSPDGKVLASTTSVQTSLWDVQTGREKATLIQDNKEGGRVRCVCFSADGKTLALGVHCFEVGKRGVQLWDVETVKLKTTLQTGEYNVMSVAFSPDGTLIASGEASGDKGAIGKITLWDAKTHMEAFKLMGHGGGVFSVAFSPDSKTLATSSHDKLVGLWDVSTGQRRIFGAGHRFPAWSVAFSPDGKALASGGGSRSSEPGPFPGEIKVWNVRQVD